MQANKISEKLHLPYSNKTHLSLYVGRAVSAGEGWVAGAWSLLTTCLAKASACRFLIFVTDGVKIYFALDDDSLERLIADGALKGGEWGGNGRFLYLFRRFNGLLFVLLSFLSLFVGISFFSL